MQPCGIVERGDLETTGVMAEVTVDKATSTNKQTRKTSFPLSAGLPGSRNVHNVYKYYAPATGSFSADILPTAPRKPYYPRRINIPEKQRCVSSVLHFSQVWRLPCRHISTYNIPHHEGHSICPTN